MPAIDGAPFGRAFQQRQRCSVTLGFSTSAPPGNTLPKKEGPNSLGGACPGLREELEKSCAANLAARILAVMASTAGMSAAARVRSAATTAATAVRWGAGRGSRIAKTARLRVIAGRRR